MPINAKRRPRFGPASPAPPHRLPERKTPHRCALGGSFKFSAGGSVLVSVRGCCLFVTWRGSFTRSAAKFCIQL
jgi:hypothetical protein